MFPWNHSTSSPTILMVGFVLCGLCANVAILEDDA